eukprot:706263_1
MTSNPFAMSKRKRKPNSVIPVIPLNNPKSSQRRRISGSTHNTTQHNTKNTNETDTKVTKHKHNGLKKRWTYHKGNPHPQSYASQTASKQKEYPQYWVVEGEKGHCSKCKKQNINCAFASGISIYGSSSALKKVNAHAKSEFQHQKAIELESALKKQPKQQLSNYRVSMNQRKEDERNRDFLPLIAMAFWIANNNVAIRIYFSLKECSDVLVELMVSQFRDQFDTEIRKLHTKITSKWNNKLFEAKKESLKGDERLKE